MERLSVTKEKITGYKLRLEGMVQDVKKGQQTLPSEVEEMIKEGLEALKL